MREAERVLEAGQPLYLALRAVLSRPEARCVAPGFQLGDGVGEGGLARQLPADVGQAVLFAGVDGQAAVAVVHAQVHGAVRTALACLQAQDLGAEGQPVLVAGGFESDVAQSVDLHVKPPWQAGCRGQRTGGRER
ncbi:hypothetical protein RMT89_29580 [Streptomyces sp. P17]|nr:hypothetical protein [Streptomyces sp. P17]MDT9699926.1 hypothetical protein [Streptomyces sp. P17]